MNNKQPQITQNQLRELLRYDPETGLLWWMRRKSGSRYPITVPAGVTRKDGYRVIGLNYGRHYGHHLAWLYMTGEWPENEIDHINGDPSDNRWVNLRAATHAQNLANKKREKGNVSGYKGVWLEQNNKYYCDVRANGIKVRGGPFLTAEAAFALREAIAKILHGEFARSE